MNLFEKRWHSVGLAVIVGSSLTLMGCATTERNVNNRNTDTVLLDEDFSDGMDNWWVEGDVEVWVEDGRLHIDADPPEAGEGSVATVWHRQPISGDVKIELDAHVLSSHVAANNINLFFFYSDPSGESLYETRDTRADAAYSHYHDLNGYIITFLRDYQGEAGPYADPQRKARTRIRRCPGFNLIAETHQGRSEPNVTYHLTVLKQGGDITFQVNGETVLTAHDDNPLQEGLFGLRTFRTKLWWDNIRITRLDDISASDVANAP